MCSSLKSFVTQTADVAAVLAMGLSKMPSQCVGVLANLTTVITPVQNIVLCLAVLPYFTAVGTNLDNKGGLMTIAQQKLVATKALGTYVNSKNVLCFSLQQMAYKAWFHKRSLKKGSISQKLSQVMLQNQMFLKLIGGLFVYYRQALNFFPCSYENHLAEKQKIHHSWIMNSHLWHQPTCNSPEYLVRVHCTCKTNSLTLYPLSEAPFVDWEWWLTSMTCCPELAGCPDRLESFSTAGNVWA